MPALTPKSPNVLASKSSPKKNKEIDFNVSVNNHIPKTLLYTTSSIPTRNFLSGLPSRFTREGEPYQAPLPKTSMQNPPFIVPSCDAIRRRINNLINNGGMKVGEFQQQIGVSANAYRRFMTQSGTTKGEYTDTSQYSLDFFPDRYYRGIKEPTAKGVKKSEESKLLDVSSVPKLHGEEEGTIPIHETCDEVRRKLAAKLREPGVTKAGLIREMKKSLPDDTALRSQQIDQFLRKQGALEGNSAIIYYAAYVFFEKLRIQQGKAKSKHRQDCEGEWPYGVDRESHRGGYWCHDSERPVSDKWGKISFLKTGR